MQESKSSGSAVSFAEGGTSFDEWTFEQVPLCLPTEITTLAKGLRGIGAHEESLLIVEIRNFFSSGLDLEYIVCLLLCVNALAMWKTGGAVTRLLVLSGDVSMQNAGRLYAFANQFRSLMQGGLARIDNAAAWIDYLGIHGDAEPLDFRDFRRAVRVFSAARMTPDNLPALASAEWFFGFQVNGPVGRSIGHFDYDVIGSHAVKISNAETAMSVNFEDHFTSGPCEILSSAAQSAYQISLDLTGRHTPFSGTDAARYLDVFSSLIGATRAL